MIAGIGASSDNNGFPMNRTARLAAAVAIGVYFWCNASPGLQAGFSQDDLMNMYRGMEAGYGSLLWECLAFWTHSLTFRPLGTLVYKVSLDLAGLNLFPLSVVRYAVFGVNLWLLYALARRLAGSREPAALAVLVFSYHQAFSPLYFNTGTLYDLFVFPLYYSALLLYVRIRQSGRFPRCAEVAAIAGIYVLALDMKELGITLPAAIMGYELLYHRPQPLTAGALARWARRAWPAPAVTGAAAVAFYFGRVAGKDGIATVGDYQPVYTAAEYVAKVGHYLAEIVYRGKPFDAGPALAIVAVLAAAATLMRSRLAAFGLFVFLAGVLPVAFITPRGLNAVYVPLAGLAMYAGGALVAVRDALLADTGAGEGKTVLRQGRQLDRVVWFVIVLIFMVIVHPGLSSQHEAWKQAEYGPIGSFMQQAAALHPQMKKDARVLVVKDPFGEFQWAPLFALRLVYRNPMLKVDRLESMDPKPTAEEAATYDYRLAFEDGKLRDVAPEAPPLVHR